MIEMFNKINWHDMYLNKVEENSEEHRLYWHVDADISEDYDGSKYEQKIIQFIGVTNYSVAEGDEIGRPAILDAEITTKIVMGSEKYRMNFGTTAGKRVVFASSFSVISART